MLYLVERKRNSFKKKRDRETKVIAFGKIKPFMNGNRMRKFNKYQGAQALENIYVQLLSLSLFSGCQDKTETSLFLYVIYFLLNPFY